MNADFVPPESPHEPAFDWVTIDQLGATLDKILQESVALYDPAKQVIVFIFLLSKSGNSMAIWRRKIPVPEILQTAYKGPIAELKSRLQPNYPVYVEELVVRSFFLFAPPLMFVSQVTTKVATKRAAQGYWTATSSGPEQT